MLAKPQPCDGSPSVQLGHGITRPRFIIAPSFSTDTSSRFKKDMWEKIAKEMALPWRAAEAMHWQIGEVEMANRANVPVFHLAGQQQTSQPSQSQQQPPLHPLSNPVSSASTVAPDTRSNSTSPQSATTAWPPPPTTYPHTHSHTLPQLSQHQQGQPASPPSGRNSNESAHSSSVMREGRDRADSARSVTAAMHRAYLPPLGDGIGRGASSQQSSGYVSPFAPQTEKR